MLTKRESTFTKNESSSPTIRLNSTIGLSMIMLLLIGSVACCSNFSALYSDWVNSNAPQKGLAKFAATEISKGSTSAVLDIKLDSMNAFSIATCVGGKSPANVQDNLRIQMKNLPEKVREDVIISAVLEGTSTEGNTQNSVTSLTNNGKADTYLAYWKTTYSGEKTVIGSNYNTCIVVANVEINAAEDIAGYTKRTEKIPIGSSPCNCGYFSCERCPDYDQRVTKTPIFKRHALTLEEQNNLNKWMSKQAVDSVIAVIDHPSTVYDLAIGMKDQDQATKDINWNPPKQNAFSA